VVSPLVRNIRAEIRALRKGRGMSSPSLERRLGENLRELAGGKDATGPESRGLAAEIADCAAALSDDLRTAIMAGLGLSAETRHIPQLKDRIIWLTVHFGYGYRTALRRVDVAEQLLAEAVAHELRRRRGRTIQAPNGWYLEELRTVLRLDTTTPEAHEHRRIVATRDDLSEVMAWWDVPRDPEGPRAGLAVEVAYGGRLLRREQPSQSRLQFMIQLPSPLRVGDSHEYGLVLRVPTGQPMRTHYIFTPECECGLFALRLRFAEDRPPLWVRRVEGETVRMFDLAQPRGDLMDLDAAGEIQVRFPNPVMYLGYGIQWGW
jgi:hypothetical protein